MVAGVTPDAGLTFKPVVLLEMEKGVFPPLGLTTVRVCVATLRLQKLPRNTRSCWVALTWGAWFNAPTGRTMTPLSETPYITDPSWDNTLLPAKFSGRLSVFMTARLSEATIWRIGGAGAVTGGVVPVVVVPVVGVVPGGGI